MEQGLGGRGLGGERQGRGLTITVCLIRAVLTVSLTVTAQPQVHALAPRAGELGGGAHRAALLVALVVALREAIAAPGRGDAVDVPRGTGELVRGARGGLWGEGRRSTVTGSPAQRIGLHCGGVLGAAPGQEDMVMIGNKKT